MTPLERAIFDAGRALANAYEMPGTPRAEHLQRVAELRAANRAWNAEQLQEQATRPEAAE